MRRIWYELLKWYKYFHKQLLTTTNNSIQNVISLKNLSKTQVLIKKLINGS